MILNGEKLPGLLMTIIRFVLPLQDHTIKKLLLIFWEIVPKTTSDGKLLQEMILVCDAYRKVRFIHSICRFLISGVLSSIYSMGNNACYSQNGNKINSSTVRQCCDYWIYTIFIVLTFLISGLAASKRVHPWLHSAIPVQAEGVRVAGAAHASDPGLPGAPPQLRAPQRRPGHLHHLQVQTVKGFMCSWLSI